MSLSEFSPDRVIFKGSCESLTCEEITSFDLETFIDADAGVEYFIYVYRTFECFGQVDGYALSVEQIEPPMNDKIDNAIALTNQDLPFEGEFTTYGALSDFGQDGCGLSGKYGVWFTYSTTMSSERIVLRVQTGNIGDVVGIQVPSDNGLKCIAFGSAFGGTLEWIAQSNVQYYILVAELTPTYAGAFEMSLQSRGYVATPTASSDNTVNPAEPTGGMVMSPPSSAVNDVDNDDRFVEDTNKEVGTSAGTTLTFHTTVEYHHIMMMIIVAIAGRLVPVLVLLEL